MRTRHAPAWRRPRPLPPACAARREPSWVAALALLAALAGFPAMAGESGAGGPPAGGLGAGDLAPAEARGKQIYTSGGSAAGGEIVAVLGEGGAEVPASSLPCAGCHGSDGRGGREGGVRPTDLTWEALSQPSSGAAGARRRPPYSDPLLIRALSQGLDAAGNRLDVAMPRYRLAPRDAADLLAYLRRLGHETDPGLTAGAVHLGVLLPGGPGRKDEAAAVEAVLAARLAELNRGGGLFGRRLVLHAARLPDPPAERVAKLREFLAAEPVFALVGAYVAGAETEMAEAVAAAAVPLIGPLTSRPVPGLPLNRYVFYLTAGLQEQAGALVEFAAGELPPGSRSLVIVRSDAAEPAAIAAAAGAEARRRGFGAVEVISSGVAATQGATLAGRLARAGVTALLVLDGGGAVRELLRQGQSLGWRPLILLPGSLPGGDPFAVVPASLADRLFISLPVLPLERTPAAAGNYRRLAAHGLPAHRLAAQTALAAAEVLIEGLKRVGREASRDKLIAALERLSQFDAGLGAPVSFGPNRRVGARGAYVAALDFARHTLGRQARWIELEP
jgi:ABC-type branched-subunit amino acid transport system substrate-binding protein